MSDVSIQPGTIVFLRSGGARMWFQPKPLQIQEANVPLAALALPADGDEATS